MAFQKSKVVPVGEYLRAFGLPPRYDTLKRLRYRNPPEKGIAWYYIARYVRERDAREYGTCISCGTAKGFSELQAGHYAPAGNCGPDLLLDPRNINGECGRCNAFDEGHLIGYEAGYIHRYGQAAMDELKARYLAARHAVHKEPPRQHYLDLIEKYRALCTPN